MKRLFTAFLSMMITGQVMASTVGLKEALDEYRYAITVEWDQQDQAKRADIQNQFNQSVKQLIEVEGLTLQDVRQVLKPTDEETLALLDKKDGKITLEEATQLLEQKSEQLYSQGSSWSPSAGGFFFGGIIALMAAEVIVLIVTHREDVCPTAETHKNGIVYACEN